MGENEKFPYGDIGDIVYSKDLNKFYMITDVRPVGDVYHPLVIKDQWRELTINADDLRAFIPANEAEEWFKKVIAEAIKEDG